MIEKVLVFMVFAISLCLFLINNGRIDVFKQKVEESFLDLQAYHPLDAIQLTDYPIGQIKSHYRLQNFVYHATTWDRKISGEIMKKVFKGATIMDVDDEVDILETDCRTREAYFYKDSGWYHRDLTHERYLFVILKRNVLEFYSYIIQLKKKGFLMK
jgi:hypothetical protein